MRQAAETSMRQERATIPVERARTTSHSFPSLRQKWTAATTTARLIQDTHTSWKNPLRAYSA